MPHRMVSQIGMLSRVLGATNLPSRPMMIPAMITPMISMYFLLARLLTLSKQPLSSDTCILARPAKRE